MTHYTDNDYPDRLVRALCGRLVSRRFDLDLQHPTCPRCAQILAEREAEPMPAWTPIGARP